MEHYEIVVKGHLDDKRVRSFDGCTSTLLPSGETLLTVALPDQAALHAILRRVSDLGLTLLLVKYKGTTKGTREGGSIETSDT